MIKIQKARVHNLKEISVNIPTNKLTVITGVSGSGKSSLAFDTIHAEGQRRYIESLSSYARQFLQVIEKPDVESIDGLSPTIAIQQKSTSRSPRSTVGTITELYDYFRLLYAAIGVPHCPVCGHSVESTTVQQVAEYFIRLPEKTRVTLLAPVVRGRKGEYIKLLDELKKEGFSRVRVDNKMYLLDDEEESIELDRNKKHHIEVAVDRLKIAKANESAQVSRLNESIELCFKLADGELLAVIQKEDKEPTEKFFSETLRCAKCEVSLPELKPRLFSFNVPYGACAKCSGLGYIVMADPERVVPNKDLSINQGAIASENVLDATMSRNWMAALAEAYGFSLDTPFKNLSEEIQKVIFYGSGDRVIKTHYEGRTMSGSIAKPFEGIINSLTRRYNETRSEMSRFFYSRFMRSLPCAECHGKRLNASALAVTVKGENIFELSEHSVGELLSFFKGLKLTEREKFICKKVLEEINNRLSFLKEVGLEYLTLSRPAHTLSGGEAQRIRLATQIGSALVGITYVLDEPSIGLHPRDNSMLIASLKRLRDIGNTVLVVEHDREIMTQADNIIDIGPKAGAEGGYIVAEGAPKEVMVNKNSMTGRFLSGQDFIKPPKQARRGSGKVFEVRGVTHNNLKNINVAVPLGKMVVVTGVSGSGKSSLVTDTIYPILANRLNNSHLDEGAHKAVKGLEYIDKVVNIDQSPIGRSPRSNPATYTGIFMPIRELFAQTAEAKARGYTAGRFSFNVKGGRCEECEGNGVKQVEMHFLPDVFVTCSQCRGRRFNDETLRVTFKGLSIADVLSLSVNKAMPVFEAFTAIRRKLQTLIDVGLGYIALGQSSTTLSGGEAQRIKLATELSKVATGSTLYLLDEPTTGLHFQDIKLLIDVLNRLVDKGNTVLIIEHNLDVIKMADYVIDMGPNGGEGGGNIVAEGTPSEIAENKNSFTGQYLKQELLRTASAKLKSKGQKTK